MKKRKKHKQNFSSIYRDGIFTITLQSPVKKYIGILTEKDKDEVRKWIDYVLAQAKRNNVDDKC